MGENAQSGVQSTPKNRHTWLENRLQIDLEFVDTRRELILHVEIHVPRPSLIVVATSAKLDKRELPPVRPLYLKTFPSRTGFPSTVVSLHHISVTRALSSSDTGVATLVQSYLARNS